MKEPRKLSLQTIYDNLSASKKSDSNLYFSSDIAVALYVNNIFADIVGSMPPPYLLDDFRMGFIRRGTVTGIINLKEVHLSAGNLVFITPGSIVEPIEASDDFSLEGVGMSAETFYLANGRNIPELFNGRMKDGQLIVSEEERSVLDGMFRLLRRLMEPSTANKNVVYNMVATISHYFDYLFSRQVPNAPVHSRATDIFNHFIRLVNLNCKEHRQLSFYAQEICVSERHLSTVVRQTSGVAAKEWIDRAVVIAAKVMLKHENLTVSQVSDKLHFPNASFFCKFFKRVTGLTPQAYRDGL